VQAVDNTNNIVGETLHCDLSIKVKMLFLQHLYTSCFSVVSATISKGRLIWSIFPSKRSLFWPKARRL
jgi:hypothetical protein